jgi:dynein heavy chain 2, cytosolic
VQSQVEEELKGVQPVIESAKRSVRNLKSENLNEVRSLKAPPEAIRNVLEAVLRVMGQSDTSWNSMKRFLAGTGVKDRILTFDAASITSQIRADVLKIIQEHPESFNPDRIYRVSIAAAPLAEWVQANLQYSKVLLDITPLTQELADLEGSLAAGTTRLQECQQELDALHVQKGELQGSLTLRTEEAAELKVWSMRHFGWEAAHVTLLIACCQKFDGVLKFLSRMK